MMEGIATGRFDVRNPELSLSLGGARSGVIHTILLGSCPATPAGISRRRTDGPRHETGRGKGGRSPAPSPKAWRQNR